MMINPVRTESANLMAQSAGNEASRSHAMTMDYKRQAVMTKWMKIEAIRNEVARIRNEYAAKKARERGEPALGGLGAPVGSAIGAIIGIPGGPPGMMAGAQIGGQLGGGLETSMSGSPTQGTQMITEGADTWYDAMMRDEMVSNPWYRGGGGNSMPIPRPMRPM